MLTSLSRVGTRGRSRTPLLSCHSADRRKRQRPGHPRLSTPRPRRLTLRARRCQILRDAESSLTVLQRVDASYPIVTALSYCQIVDAVVEALSVDRRDRLALGGLLPSPRVPALIATLPPSVPSIGVLTRGGCRRRDCSEVVRRLALPGLADAGLLATPLLGSNDAIGPAAALPGWSDADRRRTFTGLKKMVDLATSGVNDRLVRACPGVHGRTSVRAGAVGPSQC